ncbi:MAG: hypothetical protein ABH854_03235 [Candidatus Diapherotrites archaeon]|nr:hypothetical protein [Candidatus Micrarchaeota archaeon]MBU1939533.1 hypothetical protein [Candidatus Micrarchaeota archaeon]
MTEAKRRINALVISNTHPTEAFGHDTAMCIKGQANPDPRRRTFPEHRPRNQVHMIFEPINYRNTVLGYALGKGKKRPAFGGSEEEKAISEILKKHEKDKLDIIYTLHCTPPEYEHWNKFKNCDFTMQQIDKERFLPNYKGNCPTMVMVEIKAAFDDMPERVKKVIEVREAELKVMMWQQDRYKRKTTHKKNIGSGLLPEKMAEAIVEKIDEQAGRYAGTGNWGNLSVQGAVKKTSGHYAPYASRKRYPNSPNAAVAEWELKKIRSKISNAGAEFGEHWKGIRARRKVLK